MNPLIEAIERRFLLDEGAHYLPHPVPGYAKQGMKLLDYFEHARAYGQVLALRKTLDILLKRIGCHRVELEKFRDASERLGFEDSDLNMCWYCLENFADSRDHFMPRSRGGGEGSNIVPACMDCNRRKSDSLISVWVPKLTVHVRHGDQDRG
jgi:HNH endonuclease